MAQGGPQSGPARRAQRVQTLGLYLIGRIGPMRLLKDYPTTSPQPLSRAQGGLIRARNLQSI